MSSDYAPGTYYTRTIAEGLGLLERIAVALERLATAEEHAAMLATAVLLEQEEEEEERPLRGI